MSELADGLILSRRTAFSPKYTKYAIDRVAKKARAMGRDPSEIDSVSFFQTVLAKDGDEARRFAKKILGMYTIPGTPQNVLDMEGMSAEVENVKASYLRRDLGAAVSSVTDELVDKFAIAGNPDECLEELRRYIGTGLKCPIVYIHGPDHKLAAQLAAEKVAPNLQHS